MINIILDILLKLKYCKQRPAKLNYINLYDIHKRLFYLIFKKEVQYVNVPPVDKLCDL